MSTWRNISAFVCVRQSSATLERGCSGENCLSPTLFLRFCCRFPLASASCLRHFGYPSFLSFFLPLSTLPLIVSGIVAKLPNLTVTIEVANSLRSSALLADSVRNSCALSHADVRVTPTFCNLHNLNLYSGTAC